MNFKVVNRVVPDQEDFPVNQAMADIAQTFGDVVQIEESKDEVDHDQPAR